MMMTKSFAHIGHFVLRTPGHAADGLMRRVQSANEMDGPSRRGFALSQDQAERLREAGR